MFLFLDEWSWCHSAKRSINRYGSQNNLRKFWCKCFDTVFGSHGKNKKHNIIKVDVSSNKITYLCICWWWRRNTYNVKDKQYSVWLVCLNANICKIRKTKQKEEPEVLDAINKIVFLNNQCNATYLCVSLSWKCNVCS